MAQIGTNTVVSVAAVIATVLACVRPTIAQETVFTYQGQLKAGGETANGYFDMSFSLWNAALNGVQIGSTIAKSDVEVSEGRFSVELDMGAGAFDNSSRWLEIAVERFTLSPRQPITRSPYSIQTRGIFVDENNNVGIGTTNPQRNLDIEANEAILRLTTLDDSPSTVSRIEFKATDTPSAFTPLGRIDFLDENGTLRASIGGNESGPVDAQMSFSVTPGEISQMRITPAGVQFQHQIKPPVAYGSVTGGGFLSSGSTNITSVTATSPITGGAYSIEIEGGFLVTDVVQATLEDVGYITGKVSNEKVNVTTYRTTGNQGNRAFSFVIFRP